MLKAPLAFHKLQRDHKIHGLITWFLAWQLARVSGKNEAAAIRKCARKLRDQTRFLPPYELMRQIIDDKREHIVITSFNKTNSNLTSIHYSSLIPPPFINHLFSQSKSQN